MKKIALTQRLFKNKEYFEYREALDIDYAKLVSSLGFLPIVFPYEVNFINYFDELDIDGIILTGGNDLNIVNSSMLNKKRDKYEFALLDYALKKDIPIFGICRGMQLISSYFDCKLVPISNQINIRHKLKVNEKSKYAKYLKEIKEVNSFHSYGIEELTSDLVVSATDKNGLIKAIEHKEKRVFGQMWHSEREKPFNKQELLLISHFFEKEK